MNFSHIESGDDIPLDLYDPDEVETPAALLWVALVHCYCVAVLGTIGNAIALWCIGRCTKTKRPVKVLLYSVFVPSLVICLGTRPVVGEKLLSHIKNQPHRLSKIVLNINSVVYSILAQTELASIAAVAMVRALSVWAPQRPTLGLRSTLVLVIAMFIYSVLTGLGLVGLLVMGEMHEPWIFTLFTVLFFLNTTLPSLITAAAYILIIYAIRRNKRRLAASQQQPHTTTSMDNATRAILAVFISNLIFGLPHSIYHLMGMQPYYMHVIFHVIFSTHFVVDPLAFVWLNSGYRRHFCSSVKNVTRSISAAPTSSFIKSVSVSRSDEHQLSPTHRQEVVEVSPFAADDAETTRSIFASSRYQ